MVTSIIGFALVQSSLVPVDSPAELGRAAKSAIKKSLANKSVVFLGELTHGDGTSFQIKSSLVKYLYEDLGYDALIWESGFYDCQVMNREIGSTKDLRSVARMGVFSHWSAGAESFPVFELARKSQKTKRPLIMSGFDIQNSGSAGNTMMPEMLGWFEGCSALDEQDRKSFADSFELARTASKSENPQQAYIDAQLDATKNAERLLRAYRADRRSLDAKWGSAAPFRVRAIKSAVNLAHMLELNKDFVAQKLPLAVPYNVRENGNAENLMWLLNNTFKGKKVMVWAHNGHIFKGLPGVVADLNARARKGDLDSTGRLVCRQLGSKAFSLGFIASGGTWSWMGNPPVIYQEPKAGSIETELSKFGRDFGFIDFHSLPKNHSLRKPLEGILDQQNPWPFKTNWSDGYDGAIYIRTMKPRTQMP